MTNKEPGYVYILTNPSFREDWVKIGKSSRPVLLYEEAKNNRNVWFSTTEANKLYKKITERLCYCPSRSSTWNKMAILKKLFRLYQIDEDDMQFGLKPQNNKLAVQIRILS